MQIRKGGRNIALGAAALLAFLALIPLVYGWARSFGVFVGSN